MKFKINSLHIFSQLSELHVLVFLVSLLFLNQGIYAYSCVAGSNIDITPAEIPPDVCSNVPFLLADGTSINRIDNAFTSCYTYFGVEYITIGLDPAYIDGIGTSKFSFSEPNHYFKRLELHAVTEDCGTNWNTVGQTNAECEVAQFSRNYTNGSSSYGITAAEYTNTAGTVLCTGLGVPDNSCRAAGDVAATAGTAEDGSTGDFEIVMQSSGGLNINSLTITDLVLGTITGGGPYGTDYNLDVWWSCAPGVEKSFAHANLNANDTTTLTINLYNGELTPATTVSVSDSIPTDLSVNGSPTTTCGGSVSVSGQLVSLSGGTIPAASGSTSGSCTITVPIIVDTSASTGTKTNNIPVGALSTSVGSNETPTSSSIFVTAISLPEINLKKTSQTIYDPINGNTNPKAIPGAIVEYTLTANNSGNASADNSIIRDSLNTLITTQQYAIWAGDGFLTIETPNLYGGAKTTLTDDHTDSDEGQFIDSAGNREIIVDCGTLTAGQKCAITYRIIIN